MSEFERQRIGKKTKYDTNVSRRYSFAENVKKMKNKTHSLCGIIILTIRPPQFLHNRLIIHALLTTCKIFHHSNSTQKQHNGCNANQNIQTVAATAAALRQISINICIHTLLSLLVVLLAITILRIILLLITFISISF